MPEAKNRDVVIIGGGHNGLVTAFYLAKAGYKPLVLERRAQPGGAAITEEFHPGFRCSTLAHSAGPLRPDIVRDMQLEKHGLNMISTEVAVTSLSPDGRALVLYKDTEQAAQEIAKFSEKDATQYPQFQSSLAKMGRVIGKALETGTFLEMNSQPDRLDLSYVHARAAREAGLKLVIDSDGHQIRALDYVELGVGQARRAWLTKDDVLNTRTWKQIEKLLKKR